MIIDSRRIASASRLETDICIVGAGAAGITMAQKFHDKSLRVALLESGGWTYEQPTQSLYRGENVGLNYLPLDATRLRYFGGTTNHWEGQSVRLDAIDFANRDWVPNSGWPISLDHLNPYYPEAEAICELGSEPYDGSYWSKQSGSPELPYNPELFRTLVFRHSPPVRFGVKYRDVLAKSANVDVYLYANVTALATNDTGERIREVTITCLDGATFTMAARLFVLACGAIENCRLLLLPNKTHPEGIGNRFGNVGRYFMEHPNYLSGSEDIAWLSHQPLPRLYHVPTKVNGRSIKSNIVLTEKAQEQYQLLNFSFFFTTKLTSIPGIDSIKDILQSTKKAGLPKDLGFHIANMITDFDVILDTAYKRLSKAKTPLIGSQRHRRLSVIYRFEHAPNPQSRVLLSDERDALGLPKVKLRLQTGDLEFRTLDRLRTFLAAELGSMGLGRLQAQPLGQEPDWQSHLGYQFHQLGGTRMRDDPRQGVTNADCRLHDVVNLYMAGGSVFPTGGHANPTLTIVALALRLADHLMETLNT